MCVCVSLYSHLETVSVRPTFSVQGEGGVETILNLREWLKSPWAETESMFLLNLVNKLLDLTIVR